jgi:putative glycosyltransferase
MKISVVTTLYYSQSFIDEFYTRTLKSVLAITTDYEIIFVNDGSPDDSLKKVLALQCQDPHVIIVDLSRNFGHHKAMMAGLHYAQGDYIFLIDSDLEEAPELLNLFWKELLSSSDIDVVFGIQEKRKGGFFERMSGKIFYYIFSILASVEYQQNSLTARLMTKRYVENIKKFNEKELDIWGVFVLTGFNQRGVYVTKGSKGSTTYTLRKKIKHAVDSITSLSSRPLYLIFVFGFFIICLSFLEVAYIVYRKLHLEIDIEGWASIIASIWLVGGIIIFILGVIGIYLSKIFSEIKNRPLTVIKEIYKK